VLLLLLLLGEILSFVSVASVVTLALAVTPSVMASSAMPKPAAESVAANNNRREIASGLFLVLFSIREIMKYNHILDLFN
jgi:hypothetical protein